MRALVTGMSGTLGAALRHALEQRGDAAIAYVRDDRPVHDPAVVREQIAAARPDVVFHLAIASRPTGQPNEGWCVNVEWPARIAEACAAAGVRLVFTSSAMVFSDAAVGPFTVDATPDRADGYGYEKRMAEQRVLAAAPSAVVARLGWQIGDAPGGNQMLTHLSEQVRTQGCIRASRRWLPACSFLSDTAAALVKLAEHGGGLHHIDSNRGWSFYEIASALSRRIAQDWRVEADDAFVYDQRLIDPRLALPPLTDALPALAAAPPREV